MKELQYPKSDKAGRKYVVFVPRIKEGGTVTDKVLKAVKDDLKAGFRAIEKTLTGETGKKTKTSSTSKTLYIKLPLKPVAINMSHAYEKKGVMTGKNLSGMLKSVGSQMMKNIGKNVANKVIESEAGEILGLDKLKNTFLSQVGAAEYTPERNLYQNSTTAPLSFSWLLSPSNKEEILQIYKIVKAFQFFSMTQEPGSANDNGSSKWFVRSPAIWRIRFTTEGETETLAKDLIIANNEFKHMVLTEVNCSLGDGDFLNLIKLPNGKTFPIEIKLELTFDFFMDMGTTKDFLGISDYFSEVYDNNNNSNIIGD